MKKASLFLLAMLAVFVLTDCKKEIDDSQIRIDIYYYYSKLDQAGHSGGLECKYSVNNVEIMEKMSRDEKVELKTRMDLTRNCTKKNEQNPFMAITNAMADNMAGRKLGVIVFQQCLVLSYEIFDEGFKLRNVEVDNNCPESQLFKMQRKAKLERQLKETALAACTCKHEKCEPGMMEDICGVKDEKDLNGDGINEILLGDTCGGNAYICGFRLWSLLNGVPAIIFETVAFTDLQEITSNSNGKFPAIETTDISYDEKTFHLFVFSERSKSYQLIKKRVEKIRTIQFDGLPIGVEIYVDGKFAGVANPCSSEPNNGCLNNVNVRQTKARIVIKKAGYKTSITDWDWNMLGRINEGGRFLYLLEKE